MNVHGSPRSNAWKWWVCGLLLCASAINYMDRQTLANAATRISRQFELSQEQYGNLEFGFGWAFAAGSLVFGVLADRYSVRWVYPGALLLWSAVGFSTGLVGSYRDLMVCRTLLGFFEAGHWPCAVKTTQRLLAPADRSMGNSLLQSGASLGAVATPLAMRLLMGEELGTWRRPFFIVGAVGAIWVVFWLATIRPLELSPVSPPLDLSADRTGASSVEPLWSVFCSRKMIVTLIVVALINAGWQTLRAWVPKFLQEGRGYTEAQALYFNSAFYIATDLGVLGAGVLTLALVRRHFSVFESRVWAFALCAVCGTSAVLIPFLSRGWPLLLVLLVTGAGALGVFGIYHAFTQDISSEHQGKVTGLAGIAAWALSPPAQKFFGRLVDHTKSFDPGLVAAGLMPLAALLVIWIGWRSPGLHEP